MSINETLKRQETINQSAQIVYENLQQLHRILFGELPPEAEKDHFTDPSSGPSNSIASPYFTTLVRKQSTTDQILNRSYTLLNAVLKMLEPGKSEGNVAGAVTHITGGGLAQHLQNELGKSQF